MRWFETDPCYVFHPLNAYDDGDAVVVDVHRYEQLLFMSPDAARNPNWRDSQVARLHRFSMNLATGGIRSEALDDHEGEFPRVDERLAGRKHRFGYFCDDRPRGIRRCSRCSPRSRRSTRARLARRGAAARDQQRLRRAGSSCRRHDAADEDDGWVLTSPRLESAGTRASSWSLSRDFTGEPVARVILAAPVPFRLPRQLAAKRLFELTGGHERTAAVLRLRDGFLEQTWDDDDWSRLEPFFADVDGS